MRIFPFQNGNDDSKALNTSRLANVRNIHAIVGPRCGTIKDCANEITSKWNGKERSGEAMIGATSPVSVDMRLRKT
jgi:hypothetical protein